VQDRQEVQNASIGQRANKILQEKMTELSEKFAKPYPHANLAQLYAKTTVSELKKAHFVTVEDDATGPTDVFNKALFEEPEITPYIPRFVRPGTEADGFTLDTSEGSGGATRGLAYHRLLELLRFGELHIEDASEPDLVAQLTTQIDDHISQGHLLPEERDNIKLDRIITMLHTPLVDRMIIADRLGQLRKEQPFVIGLAANRLDPRFPTDELILIQGIIDVFFAEEDGLIIVDYKTDAVDSGSELVKRYKKQLDYYGEALEQLTEQKVKEKLIYSFALGEVVEV
jgi:ATP-dependent helicase/nuclease subunit A